MMTETQFAASFLTVVDQKNMKLLNQLCKLATKNFGLKKTEDLIKSCMTLIAEHDTQASQWLDLWLGSDIDPWEEDTNAG